MYKLGHTMFGDEKSRLKSKRIYGLSEVDELTHKAGVHA